MFSQLKFKIKSKNIKSFLIFLALFYYLLDKFYIIKKLINKNNYFTVFTLLKSPHINKTAQQHFGFKLYNKIIHILLVNFFNFILCLKIFKKYIFQDVSLVVLYNTIKIININTIISLLKTYLFFFNNKVFLIIYKKVIYYFINILNYIIVKILFYIKN